MAWAQYQTDPTHLYPASSNTAPTKKAPPKNKVVSTADKQKGIALHKADKYYPINQTKPIAITSNNKVNQPVTVWKNVKKPAYSSLYQDPSK
jgi:hypothetical protein